MSKKKLQLKALQRNSPAGLDDGACDEFINMRLEKGAFRPIGQKDPEYPKPPYSKVVVHRQGDFENWIGLDGQDLEYYNPVDTSVTQSLGAITDEIYDIRTLKNFLVVLTSGGLRAWLWSDGMYNEINLTGLEDRFDISVGTDYGNASLPDWTDYTDDIWPDPTDEELDSAAEQLLGLYHKKVAEHSKDNQFIGGISYRVALKLYDGSYILPTSPRFRRIYDYDILFEQGYFSGAYGGVRMRFGAAGIDAVAQFDASDGFDIEGLSKLVSSIDLFISRPIPFYEVSENSINGEFMQALKDASPPTTHNAREFLGVNPDFKELNDQPGWYKVGSIDLSLLADEAGDLKEKQMELDTDDFYANYASRQMLPVDGFSHHGSTGKASYIYNNRLVLGDTKQFLGPPDVLGKGRISGRFADLYGIFPLVNVGGSYVEYDNVSAMLTHKAKAVITLDTEAGAKRVVNDIPFWVYFNPENSDARAIFLESMTGYFDSRATTIEILLSVDGGSSYKQLVKLNLSSSKYGNFSFIPYDYFDTSVGAVPDYPGEWPRRMDVNFEGWMLEYSLAAIDAADPVAVPSNEDLVTNGNGRQVSNVNNPLFYDAANYQDVSIGKILAFGSNTDAISDSQFGQFPLYNFTTSGIWASEIGTGEVFLTKDVPVNGEVILSKDSKVDLSLGTVYATLDGLKILSGREPVEISSNVEGQTEDYFIDNAQLQEFLNLPQTVDVAGMVDKVPFTTYLQDAIIGFSKGLDDEEIYIANPNYDYVYMFDLDSKLWSKVSVKVESFINMYPELYAIGENNVINISKEVEGLVPLYFHTKPLSLDNFEEFKKLRRSFLRGFIQTAAGKYAAFYLFSSDDLINWRFETGNDYNSGAFNNIWCTHSWDSKRFYVFVFAVEVDYGPNKPTWINGIELEFDPKWNSKIR